MSGAKAVADALVAAGPGGAVAVEGLGVFHVRDRGHRGKGIGVLFTLAPEMRKLLKADNVDREPTAKAGVRPHALASISDPDLLTGIRAEILAGRSWQDECLGSLTPVITTPKTFSDPRTGKVDDIPPRPALAFLIAPALKARLNGKP
jgi:nucleoid DNA-binding protein